MLNRVIAILLFQSYLIIGIGSNAIVQIAIGFGSKPFSITQASNIPNSATKHYWTQQKHIIAHVKNGVTDIADLPSQATPTFEKTFDILASKQIIFNAGSFDRISSIRSPPLI